MESVFVSGLVIFLLGFFCIVGMIVYFFRDVITVKIKTPVGEGTVSARSARNQTTEGVSIVERIGAEQDANIKSVGFEGDTDAGGAVSGRSEVRDIVAGNDADITSIGTQNR
jgi:hypothetical protein